MTHYYESTHGTFTPITITTTILGKTITIQSAPNIFSARHIDNATHLLITTAAKLTNPTRILDLGCGYGIVAIMLKQQFPQATVTAVDINNRAVDITRTNAQTHQLDISVIQSDIYKQLPSTIFDCIVTNPPYVAGREVCYAFIDQSYDHLASQGLLLVVARHTKGGKMLAQRMEQRFGAVQTIAKKGGFHVYSAKRP